MCGRFTQSFTWAEICDFYRLIDEIAPNLEPTWNIAPAQPALVIAKDEDRSRFAAMRWGLVPFWAKDVSVGAKLINARAETLDEKAAFRYALRSRRCIIPASGFYEWRRQPKGKQPYFVTSAGGEPLSLAGLWEVWNELLTFTVITVAANDAVAPLHNRMPAMLTQAEAEEWLAIGGAGLLRPCANEMLRMWPVSTRVNTSANNDARLVEEIAVAEVSPAPKPAGKAKEEQAEAPPPKQLRLF